MTAGQIRALYMAIAIVVVVLLYVLVRMQHNQGVDACEHTNEVVSIYRDCGDKW